MRVRSILARLLLPMNEIDIAVEAYEKLFAQKVRLRFDYPDKGLRLLKSPKGATPKDRRRRCVTKAFPRDGDVFYRR